MNIIELEELAKEWDRFDEGNEYSQSFLELIAAYREAVAAINKIQNEADLPTWFDDTLDSIHNTAKRLGVE